MMADQHFTTTMDKPTSALTYSFIALFLIASTFLFFGYLKNNDTGKLGTIFIFIFVFLLAFLIIPTEFILNEETLIIRCPAFSRKIDIKNIEFVRLVEPSELQLIRTMGIGGLFGYRGYYYTRQLGSVRYFGRHKNGQKVVLSTFDKKMYVLAPDDAAGLVRALNI